MKVERRRFIFFSAALFALFAVVSISVTQFSVFLLLAAAYFFRQEIAADRYVKYFCALMLFFYAAYALSAAFSEYPLNSLRKFRDPLWFLIFVPVYALTGNDEKEELRELLVYSAAAITLFSLFRDLVIYEQPFNAFKLKSTTGHSISYGCMMAMVFFLNAALIARKPRSIPLYITAAIIFAGLLLSRSRASWFGFLAGFLCFSILYRNLKFIGIMAVVIMLAFVIVPSRFSKTFFSSFSTAVKTNSLRLELWRWGLDHFSKKPLTGIGPNNIRLTMEKDRGELSEFTYSQKLRHLHNVPVHLLVALGIPGAIGYLFYIFVFISLPIDLLKKGPDIAAAGILAAFIACAVTGFFEYNIFDTEIAMLTAFIAGTARRDTVNNE